MSILPGRRPRRCDAAVLASGLVVAGLLAGCGSSATSSSTAPSPGSTSAVVVRGDVVYASPVPADWLPATLDVYAPPGAQRLPLIVFLHGGGSNKNDLQYPDLARALAARGAVVAVPNWGPTVLPGSRKSSGWSTPAIVEEQRKVADEVACAVSFSVAHGAEYGADPARLVLVGHSAGATLTGEVMWTPTREFTGCGAAPTAWSPRGVMLWDGDWLMADATLDVIGAGLGALATAYTPWPSLSGAHTDATVELAVTPNSRTTFSREATPASDWLTWRDPTGVMTRDLAKLRAFDDGALDIVDVSDGFGAALADQGIDNTTLSLDEPGTQHAHLQPADAVRLVDHILDLTG